MGEEGQSLKAMGEEGQSLKAHRGTLILIFGILSLVICVIFGIVSWVMGNTDLAEMSAGTMDPSGEGLTKAGKILGMISVILTIVGMVIIVLFVVLGVVGAATMEMPPMPELPAQ